jgi:hypothetical protein
MHSVNKKHLFAEYFRSKTKKMNLSMMFMTDCLQHPARGDPLLHEYVTRLGEV